MTQLSNLYEIGEHSVIDLAQLDMVDMRSWSPAYRVCAQFKSGAFRFVFESSSEVTCKDVFDKLIYTWRMYNHANQNN